MNLSIIAATLKEVYGNLIHVEEKDGKLIIS